MEIGSEFSYTNTGMKEMLRISKEIHDYSLTFSGRTAIETILKNEPHIKKVLIPSYCCDAIIEPFKKVGIEIDFYDVNYVDELKINVKIKSDIDAILWCNYFGFEVYMPNFNEFINRGGIVIEDITHSLLSKKIYHHQSKYLIGSIRKWVPVLSGAVCVALNSELKEKPTAYPSNEYLIKKKEAMVLKQRYLCGDKNVCKDDFLSKFSECNNWLANNYSCLQLDNESRKILNHTDWKANCEKRYHNAKILYDGLETCNNVTPLFDISKMDCPLFLPIIVKKEKRQLLRKRLIENEVYCPIHWPKPNDKCKSNLYDIELSLICDQRYNEEDMQRIVHVIQKWDRDLENIKEEI